jgi:hypothetical protein
VPADSVINPPEWIFLDELRKRGVEFMVVGMTAAIAQGADLMTEDLDLWFKTISDPNVDAAARKAGGVLIWRHPPMISGKGFEHIDIVWQCSGLRTFDEEYRKAKEVNILGTTVKALPLARIIVSKKAAGRSKDKMVMSQLESALLATRKKSS